MARPIALSRILLSLWFGQKCRRRDSVARKRRSASTAVCALGLVRTVEQQSDRVQERAAVAAHSVQCNGEEIMKRRRFARAVVVVTALMMVLTACGGPEERSNTEVGEIDAAGVLRYGYPMPVAGLHLDPTLSASAPDTIWMSMVYGTLVRQTGDGTIVPWMAAGAEVVDPETVKVTLRPNITFSDGSAYDAYAVSTSMMRARVPATPAAKGSQDAAMKTLDSVQVIDPLTVVARLNAPMAGQFLIELSQRTGAIQSPKQIAENPEQIDTNPVGAGPFTLVANTPQQVLSFKKNLDFWDADNVKLGGVDIVNTPTGPQQTNGLLSGNLDWASYISVDGADRVKADKKFTTDVSEIYTVGVLMCTGKAPFDNVQVRQAMQLGIDREKYAQLAFGGFTGPAYSFFPENNRNFAPQVTESVSYNPDKAKQLLASAGASDTTFDLYYPTASVTGPEAEVLQAQLGEIGVKTNIRGERDLRANFFAPQKPGAALVAFIGSAGYSAFNIAFGAGSALALCGVDRPEVMEAVNQAAGLSPDDPKAIAAYQQAQEIVAENAYFIPIVAYPTIAGWNNSRVGGTPVFNAQGYPQFDSVYIGK